ncbi:MAG: PilW family protein, partial [Pseudomonadota bacterium]|nr:PilW family protein [Pseudomonadota bacterium]
MSTEKRVGGHRDVVKPKWQRGISLIELLVGIVIGLLSILAVFQTVTVWTRHTKTTASGSEAQIEGTLAMFDLERDIKQAGQGFGTAASAVLGCNVAATDASTARPFTFPLAPVVITPNATVGAPDQISVLYGDSSFFVSAQPFTSSTALTKQLVRRNGFQQGDLAIVADGAGSCALVEITKNTNIDGVTVNHDVGQYQSVYQAASATARFNTAAGTGASFPSGGTMFSMGPQPNYSTWTAASGANGSSMLRSELFFASPPLNVAEGVINVKAEYGYDADGDGQISNAEWTATLPGAPDLTRVLAVRVGMLLRSSQFEYSNDPSSGTPVATTIAAPSWADGTPAHTFLMTNVDGTGDSFGGAVNTLNPNNWRFYRYRVY